MSKIVLSSRTLRTGLGRALVSAIALVAMPLPAYAESAPLLLHTALVEQAEGELKPFYSSNNNLLWLSAAGELQPAARVLLQLVETAEYDGLDAQGLGLGAARAAIDATVADKSPAALARAELALSTLLATYVHSTVQAAAIGQMIYEHEVLQPIALTPISALNAAAQAASLEDYISGMRWLHPLYAQVRQQAMANPPTASLQQATRATLNRIAAIPAEPGTRHIIIDVATARLWMYEGNTPVDSMKVVVGKADTQTPIMSGYVRYATLNPYWNVPEELIRKTIAPNVINMGVNYLKTRGYEVLSGWEPDAELIEPSTINWRSVRSGETSVRVRQKPGGANAMGDVKFEFPNPQGIYLHDTPQIEYMKESVRQLSNGCVRLEDAERFGNWLFNGAMPAAAGSAPEQRLDLAEPVPIYITYVTAHPDTNGLVLSPDPYALDAAGASLAGL